MLTLLLSAQDNGTAWRHALAPGKALTGFGPVDTLGPAKPSGRISGVAFELATAPERLAAYTQLRDPPNDHARPPDLLGRFLDAGRSGGVGVVENYISGLPHEPPAGGGDLRAALEAAPVGVHAARCRPWATVHAWGARIGATEVRGLEVLP